MKQNIVVKCLLTGVVVSVGAFADMTIDKSSGVLTITSNISGTVIAKIVGPNDEIVVNEMYEGNSFSWTPSGTDGAYRYDIRVIPVAQKSASVNANTVQTEVKNTSSTAKSDYAGGSVEVQNGKITMDKEV